jgi:hypothetical protein
MLKSILNFFTGTPANVNTVIRGITRGISDLRAVGEENARKCNYLNEQAKDIQAEADVASAEADRAFVLAERFEKLIAV